MNLSSSSPASLPPQQKIIVVEEEDEDRIPGPQQQQPAATSNHHKPPQSSFLNRSKHNSILSFVLNVSNGGTTSSSSKQNQPHQRKNSNVPGDELQLSNTEHHHQWAGSGILANVADLALAPETFAAGCNLLQAAARGDVPVMKAILAQRVTHANFRDYDRRTALHVAASEGHLHSVQYLIQTCHVKVNRSDRWGGSPLDDAHRHRHLDVVAYLRQHGAVTGSGNRLTNLIKAAADGDLDEVQTLLKFFTKPPTTINNNNNLNMSMSGSGSTRKRLRAAAVAASAALDVNQGDYDKRTALHLAAGEGHTEIVQALIEAGADVNCEDRWFRRPLDDAAESGQHPDTVALLLTHGAARGRSHHANNSNNFTDSNVASEQVLDGSSQRAMDNMRIEFQELEMIDRIGSGAFGEIYKCRWRGTLVAVKIIKSAKIRRDWTNRRVTAALQNGTQDIDEAIRDYDEAAAASELHGNEKDLAIADFRQEISVLKSLRHPHIVLLLAYSTTENYECLISELMKCSLLDVFKSHLVQGTRMPIRTQIIYATQLAQGMNYLHTCKPPIIHRDLKPANLLVDHSGVLKISDFGLSRVRPDPGKNETEAFAMTGETGSYRFMAPEVFLHKEYNETVDVYSYGMIFFYLLAGRPPWPNLAGVDAVRKAAEEGDRPNIPRDVDQRLQDLLKECWDENANVRPPFRSIINVLAKYSKDAFHQDSNDVLTASGHQDANCNCVIQ